jgi:DNA-binding MarR family transcriptional regulator
MLPIIMASDLKLDGFIPYRLSFTSNLVSDSIAATYEALFGINIPEWRVVAWVAEAGSITQQDICDRTRMDKTSVSRAAISLTQRGLLERRANAQDRRSRLLVLTPAGEELYAAIAPKALELERKIFSSFDPEEIAAFKSMLLRIDAAALKAAK